MTFTNEAKPKKLDEDGRPGAYGFEPVPKLLFHVSRLFQTVISQVGTYHLTGAFHTHECSIYKSEGGCNLPGVGDLVLGTGSCYFDGYYHPGQDQKKECAKLAKLITHVVLEWDPNDPVASMTKAASSAVGAPEEKLLEVLGAAHCGGVFGGNALSTFFNWNPFSEPPDNRAYRKFLAVQKIAKETEAEVDQQFADEDLGKDLLKRINEAIKKTSNGRYYPTALCCSPNRRKDGSLHFWVNTGRTTQIDGWMTQEELEAFIASGQPLQDRKR